MFKVRISCEVADAAQHVAALQSPALEKLIAVEVSGDMRQIGISFSEKLSYSQYALIHDFLVSLTEAVHGRVFDKGCMLGYLADGTAAYIVTNWDVWSRFLHESRLHSAKGEYVHVYADGNLLDSGILLDYTMSSEEEAFAIMSCTILTSEGEVMLSGDTLTIEAEQRF